MRVGAENKSLGKTGTAITQPLIYELSSADLWQVQLAKVAVGGQALEKDKELKYIRFSPAHQQVRLPTDTYLAFTKELIKVDPRWQKMADKEGIKNQIPGTCPSNLPLIDLYTDDKTVFITLNSASYTSQVGDNCVLDVQWVQGFGQSDEI